MRRRETVSNRYLQRVCSYWRRPEVLLREGASHTARSDGDELHALAEAEFSGDDDAAGGERALAMLAALRPLLDGLRARVERFEDAEALAEVSYGYDPNTGDARVIGVGLSRDERDALSRDVEYVGTADLVLLFRDGDGNGNVVEVEVYDHKTTYVGGEPQDATDQLVTYASLAARAYGATTAIATPIVVHEEGASFGVPTSLDEIAIDAELEELSAELLEDVSNANPHPGPWCSTRYCKARAACPATTEAIERFVPAEALVRPYVPGQGCASPEQVGRVRVLRKLLEEACAAMRADERDGLERFGDIELPDGSRYYVQKVHTERADLTVPGATDVLRRENVDGAIKNSVAWSDIKKLGGKDGEAAVREGLRLIGALRVSDYEKAATKPAKGRAKTSPVAAFEAAVALELAKADALKS